MCIGVDVFSWAAVSKEPHLHMVLSSMFGGHVLPVDRKEEGETVTLSETWFSGGLVSVRWQ